MGVTVLVREVKGVELMRDPWLRDRLADVLWWATVWELNEMVLRDMIRTEKKYFIISEFSSGFILNLRELLLFSSKFEKWK